MPLLNDAFDNLALFYENSSTVIYKGVRKDDGVAVILKSHKNPDEMFRIKHEYDLLADKDIPGVTNVLGISYNDDKNYLVMADKGALVLDDYLSQYKPALPQMLQIAENAAHALATVHAQGIIHCDIKPANILVHPKTLRISFIDFGISFSVHQRDAASGGFAGTLEFMAPEQTGRLNMTVGTRSDLYSLGITLYYMLCGTLPFTGESAVELIHAQTVLPPAPLSQHTNIDPTLEMLVLKLMEKNPKKRYQTAEALAYDLAAIRALIEEHGFVDTKSFSLGEKDIFTSLEPGQKLFAKQVQLDEMKAVLNGVSKEAANLVLLHGPAGSGKTSLLNSLEQYAEENRALLLKGSFEWTDSGEPYSAIRELFEGFELFAYNANLPLPEYRTRLLEALGENAGALIDILPSFAGILGAQPPAKKLGPVETQQRARLVFSKTLEILCDAPYPFVLIFENAQWADENSLSLLLGAIEEKNVGNCVMLLSYRDDDPAFLSHLAPRTSALNLTSLTVTDLAVTHLSAGDVRALVLDFLDQDSPEANELADIVYTATGGVLSQIRSYLQQLYRSGAIRHHADTDTWTILLENMESGVLESIEGKYSASFETLTPTGKDMLTKLACMGESFDLQEAAYVFDFDLNELKTVLAAKAEKGFVVPDKRSDSLYSFTHKTVFEVCYSQLDKAQRDACHKQIVDKLYARYKDDADAMLAHSTLFTRQILSSDRSLYSDEVLLAVSRSKLTAAEQIMVAANLGQAIKTFQNALRLMGEDPFRFDYRLAYEVYLNYALCCFAQHDYDMARELFEVVVANADGEADRYTAYYTIVKQYLSTADWDNAKIYAKRYLADEGLLLGAHEDPAPAAEVEYQRFRELTGDEGITMCTRFEPSDDKLVEHHGNMQALLAAALLFSLEDEAKCRYYLYRTINYSVERERIFSEFTLAFCVGAARYATVRDYKWAKHLIEAGLEYAEQKGTGQAFLWCVYGNMISHWVNPLAQTLEIYKQAKYHAMVEGNAFYEAYADMMLLNYHSFIGENLEEYHRETQATLHNLERAKLDALKANFTTFRQYARCLLGRTVGPDSFDDAQYEEASLESIRGSYNGIFNDNFLFVYRLRALYIHGFFEKAVEYAERYKALSEQYNMRAYLTDVQFHYYYSMALIEVCRHDMDKLPQYLPIIEENQKNLGFYAELIPLNFEFKHMLVNTAVKALTQDTIEIPDKYAECHRGFIKKGLIWDAVFVERLIGDFWAKHGIPQYVIIHKKNALGHYKNIGAHYLIRMLHDVDEEYDERIHASKTMRSTHMNTTFYNTRHTQSTFATHTTFATQHTRAENAGINANLDFGALLEVLEKLIDRDTLPALTSEFARLLLQNGNAERALLFLDDGPSTSLYAARYAISAEGDFNEVQLPLQLGVLEDDTVPKKLVELARTKGEVICANAARNEYRLLNDAYLEKQAPQSLLCLPIQSKGKYIGAVYLENAQLAGSFPEGRVRFLQALVGQTSALIVNLQNVAKMADYTKDLERRLSTYLGQQNALIAGIAHEINSPVGVCVTVASKALEKTDGIIETFEAKQLGKGALQRYLEETREGLDIITNNVQRAGDLVRNFKEMSVEQSTEVFENLELAPTIRSIVEYVRPGVKKKIEKVDIDIPENLWVHTSSGVLAQIFTNLIMNSAIHGFEHRESKDGNHAKIEVKNLDSRGEIEIRYSDNGKGMTPEELEKVFQPFFTTKRNRGGSGLGGHIILTLVTQTLGGSVRCESESGKGTTFIINLPKQAKQVAQEES